MTASEYDDLKRFVEDYEPEQENTMTELKPCPFCPGGGRPEIMWDEHEEYFGACRKCGLVGKHEINPSEAIKAWNTRYEPTCHDFGGEEGTNGEGYDFACSACGFCTDITEPNYCPNCGAKVVSE